MTKVFITGANGQLGSDIVNSLSEAGFDVVPFTHEMLDIGDLKEVKKNILKHRPDVLINTAAFHHVDQCEQDANRAIRINARSPGIMAQVCNQQQIYFIHFSTDYVFDGKKRNPYHEDDYRAPLNIYGISKALGEKSITQATSNHLILRVSSLYGKNPCRAKNGLNFVQLMLKLAKEKGEVKVVDDEFVSPTYTAEIADRLPELINKRITGIVHMTSEGECSWYEFAKEIFDYTQTPVTLHKANSSDFIAKTPRPKYSVMENTVLKKLGIKPMSHWKDALHQYINELN